MKGFAFDLPAYVLFRIFPKKELADSLYSAPSMGSYRFFKMGYMIKFRSVFLTALLTAGLFSNSSRAGLVVSERATLQPETVMNRTGLGVTLAVDGDRMLVGALGLPVQVLARTGSDWSFTDEIPLPPPNPSSPGPGVNDSFG